jgi:hypothetical protein
MFGFGSGLGTISKNAANTAADTGASYGSQAGAVNAQLMPFLTRELNSPQGYTQQQTGAMLNQAEAGAGGAAAGLNTEANLKAARDRNSGGFSGALDEAARDKEKTLSGISSGIAGQNAELEQQHQQAAASGLSNLYGQDTGAQLKAMGLVAPDVNASVNANTAPWTALSDFGDMIAKNGEVAAQFCPAKGSPYLMFGGTSKSVEELRVGEKLEGIAGDPQIIEEIESVICPVIRVTTENGFVARNSYSHAFALPDGGFVVAYKSEGCVVKTAFGPSQVISVAPDGEDLVFNVITGGSHTYRASGIWALGVGEAERHVSMETWREIGAKLAERKGA